MRRRALQLLGLAAVLPLVLVDPAMIVLVYDAELLALVGSVGLAFLRGDLRVVWLRVRDSQVVSDVRHGAAFVRRHPRALWDPEAA